MDTPTFSVKGTPTALLSSPQGELWTLTQEGRIYINNALFLDISNRLPKLRPFYDERGLLALAFSPTRPNVYYIYYTTAGSDKANLLTGRSRRVTPIPTNWNEARSVGVNVIEEWEGQQFRRRLLAVRWPTLIHNGKDCLTFAPDGRLLWASGDGGGAYDPLNLASSDAHVHGKIIALNVNTQQQQERNIARVQELPPYAQVLSKGLRNPVAFDYTDNTYYLTVAGEHRYEWAFAFPNLPRDFGWRRFEGIEPVARYQSETTALAPPYLPLTYYRHNDPTFTGFTGIVITSGRGYKRKFFFLDWQKGLFVVAPNFANLQQFATPVAVKGENPTLATHTALARHAGGLWAAGTKDGRGFVYRALL